MTVRLSIASAIALVLISCLGLATVYVPKSGLEIADKGNDMAKKDDSTGATVKREGNKVWVEGVPDIKMTQEWMRLRGMEILLKHRGEEMDLNELLAYSGEAFHLCHASKWELRTGLCMSSNPWTNLAQTYGYASRWTQPSWFFGLKGLKMEERWQKSNAFLDELWESIDAGQPVLLGGVYGECGMWRVVAGYDRDNKKICYVGGEKPYVWTDLIDDKVKEFGFWDSQVRGPIDPKAFGYGGWLVNAAFLLGEKKWSPSEKEKTLMALQRAVEMFGAEEFRTDWYGGVTYSFGEKAYEQWAHDLHELDYPDELEKPRPEQPEIYDMSNFRGQVHQVVTGRTAAAVFCERAAKLLPKAKAELLAAAKAYREEVAIGQDSFAFFLEDEDETRKVWLSDETKRETGVTAILRMLEKERVAIGEIDKALAAEKLR